jgi:spore germination protein KB
LYRKFIGLSILDISEYLGGKPLKIIVGMLFIFYFLFTIVVILCRLVNCLRIIYYPMTNLNYIILLIAIADGLLCTLKNNAYAKASFVVFPLSVLATLAVFAGNLKNLDFQNIFPIFGKSINNTFISGIANLFTFGGISYLYFLPSKLKNPSKFSKISILSITLSGLIIIIIITTISLMFNPNLVSGPLFPLYTSVRYIEFGTFFQRLDSAFLLIKLISFFSFLGIFSNIVLDITQDLTKIIDVKPLIYPYVLMTWGLCSLIDTYADLDFFENEIFKFLFFSIVIGTGLLILFTANIKKIFSKRSAYE